MDDRDAWLEDVKRWYFDERRAEGEHGLPIVVPQASRRHDGPSVPPRRWRGEERPDAS